MFNKTLLPIWFILPLLIAVFAGHETLLYYHQAVAGQLDIMRKRRSIEAILADPGIDEQLKERLRLVVSIREFAGSELGLPAGKRFIYYADHGRSSVAWNVFAAPELSLSPKTWCFPVAGCVIYKGFFQEDKAMALADRLSVEGYDVHVSGVQAYSTLGWFSDPIFEKVLNRKDEYLAALIFHELAHEVVYIKGDTPFNEGFAVAVEQEGVRRWLESQGAADRFDAFLKRQKRRAEFADLVADTRTRLSLIYLNPETEISEKLLQKKLAFEQMTEEYGRLKASWNGWPGYDRWFDAPLNNARLIPVGAYSDHVPAFAQMISFFEGDMAAFYAKARDISRKDRQTRNRILSEYTLRALEKNETAKNKNDTAPDCG